MSDEPDISMQELRDLVQAGANAADIPRLDRAVMRLMDRARASSALLVENQRLRDDNERLRGVVDFSLERLRVALSSLVDAITSAFAYEHVAVTPSARIVAAIQAADAALRRSQADE